MLNAKTLVLGAVIALAGFALGRVSVDGPRAEAQILSQWGGGYPRILYTASEDGKTVYAWKIGGGSGRNIRHYAAHFLYKDQAR